MEETYPPYHQSVNRQLVNHIQRMLQSYNTNATAQFFEGSCLNSWSRLLVRTARVGRPAPRILERLTGRHFLDRLEEGGKSLHRQCIVCGPAEREMLPPTRSVERSAPADVVTWQVINVNNAMFLCVSHHVLKSIIQSKSIF